MGSVSSILSDSFINTRDNIFQPFVLPAPSSSYNSRNDDIDWIDSNNEGENSIPIIYHKLATDGRPTIIFSHGNGCDIGQCYDILTLCGEMDINIIIYDYPGYGLHDGFPSQNSCFLTIERVYNYVIECGVKYNNIILFGQSIGTGPTTWLAKKLCTTNKDPKSIILMSPYTSALGVVSESVASTVRSSYIVSNETLDIFDNYHHIQNVTCPVKIIHGTTDSIIPYNQGLKIHQTSQNSLSMGSITGGGHNDLWYRYKVQVKHHIKDAII